MRGTTGVHTYTQRDTHKKEKRDFVREGERDKGVHTGREGEVKTQQCGRRKRGHNRGHYGTSFRYASSTSWGESFTDMTTSAHRVNRTAIRRGNKDTYAPETGQHIIPQMLSYEQTGEYAHVECCLDERAGPFSEVRRQRRSRKSH